MAADRPPTPREVAKIRADAALRDAGVFMSSEARELIGAAMVEKMILMWHDGKLAGVRDMTDRIVEPSR